MKAVRQLQQPAESQVPDEVLVAATLGGDRRAFDRLVERYQRQALSVSYRLLGNSDDAAEVSQEAFLRAYRSLEKLKDRPRFGAWLMRIVSNLSLNYRRSRRTNKAVSLDHDGEMGDGPDNLPSRFNEGQDVPELQQAIRAALSELPEKQRLALVLYSMEGMPQKDVAEILECSVELVKWNVFQARKFLKEKLVDFI